MFKLVIWTDGIITKKLALVSLDLDKRVESCDRLKTRGQTVRKLCTDRSMTKTNRKKTK